MTGWVRIRPCQVDCLCNLAAAVKRLNEQGPLKKRKEMPLGLSATDKAKLFSSLNELTYPEVNETEGLLECIWGHDSRPWVAVESGEFGWQGLSFA